MGSLSGPAVPPRADRAVLLVATGAGLGYAPAAPGTVGSLLGIPLHLSVARLASGPLATALLLAAAVIVACWVAGRAEALLGGHDSGCIVIDEVVGMAIALAGLGSSWTVLAIGFALFRVLDIVKPWPAGAIDAKLGGGAGVVLDDVVSGVYANLLLRLVL